MTGRYGWPEEARVAAVGAIGRRTGPHLQITVPATMVLATDIQNAVTPLIRVAERDQIAAETVTRDQLEQAVAWAGPGHRQLGQLPSCAGRTTDPAPGAQSGGQRGTNQQEGQPLITELRSEADVMRTLTTGTRPLDWYYQQCYGAGVTERDGGHEPVPGNPSDFVWKRRVRNDLQHLRAKGRGFHIDRTIWAIRGTPARPERLTLIVVGGTPREFELRLAEAVTLLRELDEPADLILADPPWALRRGDDPRFANGHGYRRDQGAVVGGYIDVPPAEYPAFTLEWIQAAAEALRPGGQLAVITGPQRSAHVQVAAEQAGLTWITSIAAKKDFPLATTRQPSCAHWRVTVMCRGSRRHPRRVFNPPIDQPAAQSGRAYPLDWWVANGNANRRGDLLRYDNMLPQKLVNRTIHCFSDPGDHVVVPFVGGGTEMIGCWQLDRRLTAGDKNLQAIRFAGARLLAEHAWRDDVQPPLDLRPTQQVDAQLAGLW